MLNENYTLAAKLREIANVGMQISNELITKTNMFQVLPGSENSSSSKVKQHDKIKSHSSYLYGFSPVLHIAIILRPLQRLRKLQLHKPHAQIDSTVYPLKATNNKLQN